MSDADYHELFPLGADDAPYRKLTGDYVSTGTFEGSRLVKVTPDALTLLAAQAFADSAHLLRPGHLAQLRAILDDPEASANDKFVASDLLKNANIAAGRVLPMALQRQKGQRRVLGTLLMRRQHAVGKQRLVDGWDEQSDAVSVMTLHASKGLGIVGIGRASTLGGGEFFTDVAGEILVVGFPLIGLGIEKNDAL